MRCCVKNCPTKKPNPEEGISIHVFPMDPDTRQKWTDFVSKENGEPFVPSKSGQGSRLCGLHFDADNYLDKRPKWRGVPTVSVKRNYTPFKNKEVGMVLSTQNVNANTNAVLSQTVKVEVFQSSYNDISTHGGKIPEHKRNDSINAAESTQDEGQPKILKRNLMQAFPRTPTAGQQHNFDVGPSPPKKDSVDPSLCKRGNRACRLCGHSLAGSTHIMIKGSSEEEVLELQSQLRQEKRIKFPGDIEPEDMDSPRRARRCLAVLQDTIENQKKKLRSANDTIRGLKRKCESLQSLVSELQDKKYINVETRDLMEEHGPEMLLT
ncbi:uncharacterized protein LOC113215361 [Frankliniella occidentalis]|uniref:Uncharacterized protein LOC113215361 n=1 Tax=Frankliniella occidentalis TaxID=133901 RepID=A0A9C6X6D7_FRAOC|nr:uncharacterized protein LOC113215361 [Frankliniella occidentalis]